MAYDKEKNMTQKYYNFEKLTPDKDADISVYEEAIEFVFDNSDVTNIATQVSQFTFKRSGELVIDLIRHCK